VKFTNTAVKQILKTNTNYSLPNYNESVWACE